MRGLIRFENSLNFCFSLEVQEDEKDIVIESPKSGEELVEDEEGEIEDEIECLGEKVKEEQELTIIQAVSGAEKEIIEIYDEDESDVRMTWNDLVVGKDEEADTVDNNGFDWKIMGVVPVKHFNMEVRDLLYF